MFILLALLAGMVTGLRTMIVLTALSWAACFGIIDLLGTIFAWLGASWTPWILSVLAVAELVADKLPSTPSRKVPMQFGARILVGALVGGVIGNLMSAPLLSHGGPWVTGAVAGAIGAVIGTLVGAGARAKLAATFGQDRPAALIEDLVAILGALAIVHLV